MRTLFCLALLLALTALISAGPLPAADNAAFGKTTVIVFSQTGNTARLAGLIAAKTGGAVYTIEPLEPLPTTEKELIAMEEARHEKGTRPALKSPPPDFSGNDLIFIGAPTWFGDIPDLVAVFLETADFKGAKVAVFSSAGTRPGETLNSLKAKAKNGVVLEPTLLQARGDDQSDEAVAKKVDDYLAAVAAAIKP